MRDTRAMPTDTLSNPMQPRTCRDAGPVWRRRVFVGLLACGLVAIQATSASAQSGQIGEFSVAPGFVGLLPFGQVFPNAELALGVADLTEQGGQIEATLWQDEGFVFEEAVAPGFAIFDRTLRVVSSLDPVDTRYQLRFGTRRLRERLSRFDDFARARFVQYDRLRAGRVRFERIRSDLRQTLLRAEALDPQTGRIRFPRFARRLDVMRYDEDEMRWQPAYERVGRRWQPARFFGRAATWTPGHHGFDPNNALVWSVQDRPGTYALGLAVPEPAGLSLLAAGVAALGWAARRRARG